MDLNDMELLKLKEQLTPEQNRNIERLVDEWFTETSIKNIQHFKQLSWWLGGNENGIR